MIRLPVWKSAVSPRGSSDRTISRDRLDLLPNPRFAGPIPWVIAILIALVVVAAAGGLSLRNLVDSARGDLAQAVTIQIVEADTTKGDQLALAAAEAVRDLRFVTSVRVVPERELEELLEPWLGTNVEGADLPIPALVDVELSRAADPVRIAQLRASLADALGSDAARARVDAQSDWLEPVYDALVAVQWLALALIALVATATAAAVWLAARSAFANHRDTVEIIHLLGGSDAQVTWVFQRSVLRDAMMGAAIGFALGLVAVWVLAQQFAGLDSGLANRGGLGLTDWLVMITIPIGAVLLALITGRITIGAALKSLL